MPEPNAQMPELIMVEPYGRWRRAHVGGEDCTAAGGQDRPNYVRADLFDAQRKELEELRAAVTQAINIGTHEMIMDRLHSGSCSKAMSLCMSILECAITPTSPAKEGDDA